VLNELVATGFMPALSYELKADHGFMTVYYELDPTMQLPMVPIIMNCTTPPLITLRQSFDFGVALGEAIRSYPGLDRVALVGGGGLSHFVGEPRVGDIDEEFDRWFLDRLGTEDLADLLDMPNDELLEAGNGTGEVRAWVTVAGAMRGHPAHVLAYEPIYEWINGMGVVLYDGD
jgi:aromatic ring-opening dioxygenase catalytic subunit (LigB family)